jgi:hypothetical protein
MIKRIDAPFTEEQCEKLRQWQEDDHMHPYTCTCGQILIVTKDGLYCERCNRYQKWAILMEEQC